MCVCFCFVSFFRDFQLGYQPYWLTVSEREGERDRREENPFQCNAEGRKNHFSVMPKGEKTHLKKKKKWFGFGCC